MIISELFEGPQQCPECGGISFSDLILAEKKDACYHKVKASAKVWPSAYASGRLVQCRKKGAANYGNKSEGMAEGKDEKIAQLKKDHETAVYWSKNDTNPHKREAARQKAEKIKRHLETQYKQGVAEGLSDTQKKIEDTINKLEDRLKHAKSDEQWDNIKDRIERLQAGLNRSKQGVAEGMWDRLTTIPELERAIENLIMGYKGGINLTDKGRAQLLLSINKGKRILAKKKQQQDMAEGVLDEAVGMMIKGAAISGPDDQDIADRIAAKTGGRVDSGSRGHHILIIYPTTQHRARAAAKIRKMFPGIELYKSGGNRNAIDEQGMAEGMKSQDLAMYCEKLVAEKGWDAAYKYALMMANVGRDPAWNGVLKYLDAMKDGVTEEWSQKYKSSINCANPKGFSQKAHCAGRKKNESIAEAPAPGQRRGPLDLQPLEGPGGGGGGGGGPSRSGPSPFTPVKIPGTNINIPGVTQSTSPPPKVTVQKRGSEYEPLAADVPAYVRRGLPDPVTTPVGKPKITVRPGETQSQAMQRTRAEQEFSRFLKGQGGQSFGTPGAGRGGQGGPTAAQTSGSGQVPTIKLPSGQTIPDPARLSPSGQYNTQSKPNSEMDKIMQKWDKEQQSAPSSSSSSSKSKTSPSKFLQLFGPDKMNEQSRKKREKPEVNYDDEYDAMVARVKKLAGLGPMKTVYDPAKRQYRNMPTAVQPKK